MTRGGLRPSIRVCAQARERRAGSASVATSGGIPWVCAASRARWHRLLEAARFGRERELLTCIVDGNLSQGQSNPAGHSALYIACNHGYVQV